MAPGRNPEDVGLGEYTARLWAWNKRHAPEGDAPPPPTPERLHRNFAKIPAAAFGRAH